VATDASVRPAASGLAAARAVTSPANLISSSRPRFWALNASTRHAQAGEASRGNRSGGNAAERRVDAAARQGNSGDGAKALRSTGSTSSSAGLHLTSLRGSWVAPRRRKSGDDGASSVAARLGLRGLAEEVRAAARARVGAPGGAAA
jgi:hypothetical protein